MPGSITDKASLRRAILARRDAFAAPDRDDATRHITEQLLRLSEFDSAGSVLAYLSFGSEYDTTEFVAAILARGKSLVLPRVNRQQRRLEVFLVTDLACDVASGIWGIREPRPDRCLPAETARIGLILAPGVAFTSHCDRLGYGGGFYDGLLSQWTHPRPAVIAAAFGLQIVDALPMGPTDVPVDMVVTEDALYRR